MTVAEDDDPKPFELGSGNPNPEFGIEAKRDGSEDEEDHASPSPWPSEERDDATPNIGRELADGLMDNDFHPVILVGTANSGKTSLLLSLFALIRKEVGLQAALRLCEPIIPVSTDHGALLYDEAEHTFDVKTLAFLENEKIPATSVRLPFFIPVQLRPMEGPTAKFAFMESNGEWFAPNRERGKILGTQRIFAKVRGEIENLIANYSKPITFLYLLPYTQREVYSEERDKNDAEEKKDACLAIEGFLRAYPRLRVENRQRDRHLMLLTKWDASDIEAIDTLDAVIEDRDEVTLYCERHYGDAISAFYDLSLSEGEGGLNAYCSGLIDRNGLRRTADNPELQEAINDYPTRLWKWLYGNALRAQGEQVSSPFPEPESLTFKRAIRRFIDFVSGT